MLKKPKDEGTQGLLLLRKKAEKVALHNNGGPEDNFSEKDQKWLLHELQVQKIELEMQNDQLRLSNESLELQRSKLASVYELAPVGFFILDMYGIIREVNNTGCKIMNISKKNLIGINFQNLVIKQDVDPFIDFLESIQLHDARQSCQLTMLKQDGKFYAQVEGIVPVYKITEDIRCYIAIIDITEQKNAKAIKEKQILKATLAAQENERKRISESLHNSVGQLLYGIKLKIDQQKEINLYKDLDQLLDQAIKETRNISFELAPSILKDFGLRVTLDEMAERLAAKNLIIKVNTNLNKRLELSVEVDIFRMIQELVNNSIKHGASTITIGLRKADNMVIEVSDNGSGFNNKKTQVTAGSGLAAIRNKLGLYNGEMFIESEPGKGSIVRLILNEIKPG